MSVINKIEDLVFQSRALASVEILKDRHVIVKMRCMIEKLTDDECRLLTSTRVRYRITGMGLQVKEYGDTYVKITGDRIDGFLIEGDQDDK